MLKRAKVIDEDDIKTDVVSIGSKVSIYDMEYDEEVEYYIVGSTEADPSKYKISNESPVGKALIGKAKDEIVEVQVPDGVIKYKILDIRK